MDIGLGTDNLVNDPDAVSTPGVWLLIGAVWNDDGIWLNSETWEDT